MTFSGKEDKIETQGVLLVGLDKCFHSFISFQQFKNSKSDI